MLDRDPLAMPMHESVMTRNGPRPRKRLEHPRRSRPRRSEQEIELARREWVAGWFDGLRGAGFSPEGSLAYAAGWHRGVADAARSDQTSRTIPPRATPN